MVGSVSPSRRRVSELGAEQGADPAEVMQKPLGELLGIDARNGQREEIFDQLVIVKAGRPSVEKTLAQPRSVRQNSVSSAGFAGAPVHAAPSSRPSEQWRLKHRKPPSRKQSCRIWNGRWPHGLVKAMNERRRNDGGWTRRSRRIALLCAAGRFTRIATIIAICDPRHIPGCASRRCGIDRLPIATHYLKGEFQRRGVTASYHLDRVGLRTQEVSDLVLGDPNRPASSPGTPKSKPG